MNKTTPKLFLAALLLPTLLLCQPAASLGQSRRRSVEAVWGPRYGSAAAHGPAQRRRAPARGENLLERLRYWNEIAINASGLDHTPPTLGEQLGPGRSSRAMAIVHIAMFDALNSIVGGYQGYTNLPKAPAGASTNAAVAQAARDTLAALFPSQQPGFDALLAEDLSRMGGNGRAKADGIVVGKRAANAILALRSSDGSQHAEPALGVGYVPSGDPGDWGQDPISLVPLAVGAMWGGVTPFVMTSGAQFRVPPPPLMTSPEYATAFDEVRRLGGYNSIERTEDQKKMGIFWAYDGTPSLCAPPRLYNQITVHIAEQMGTNAVELARLLALVNVAMADAGVAAWESKYYYKTWRPVTGIRRADDDGNAATTQDVTFTPLGAPASNLTGPNFTPPFPAYPSGHAVFGGALFQTLRKFYGTDDIAFTFVSDEYNGVTRGNDGMTREFSPRTFTKLSQAEEENGQSRIYLGIHWSFDKTAGITQGQQIANYVWQHAFKPAPRKNH